MTSGPALPCPRCRRPLGPECWRDANSGVCPECSTPYEFVAFPALAARPARVVPQAAVLEEDSVCFFHAENRADAICDRCGRLLCAVCTVSFGGRTLCPPCIAASRTGPAPELTTERVLYDSLALAVAAWPLLVFPLTVLSAPVALGLVVYGWKKPGSLVRGRSVTRLVVAGILALLELGGWVVLLVLQAGRP